jgi:TonB family protein
MQVRHSVVKAAALFVAILFSAASWAQQPVTGYAPVNGLKMYYEVHGKGEPVVLLHGSFMTITGNWQETIAALSKTRQVIAVEMQGHGRTADTKRDFSYDNLSDDISALLDYLKIGKADIVGYSMGGGVALNMAIRHPEHVRKVVSISAVFRHNGWVQEALDAYPHFTADAFNGSPIEAEYKKLSPTPNEFPNFVKRAISMDLKPYDFGAEKLKATQAPILFIHGDADGVRLEHIAEMFRLKGGEIMGDMRPRSASRLAVLPDTTHVTLLQKIDIIAPMINDFLGASTQEVVSASSLRRTHTISPAWPQSAARVEGWVLLRFTVQPDGTVIDVEVQEASPAGVFDSSAVEALRQWKFEPVEREGKKIAQRAELRMNYALPPGESR